MNQPAFIVGASRSGTALMRSCLNGHPAFHIAGETHYFDDLRPRMGDRATAPLDDDARRMCEDYFLGLAHRPYGHGGDPQRSPLSRAVLRARADALGEGSDAYFAAYCRLAAEAQGASRWGEKTPRHVFRLHDIVQRFPDARVICMVRDPRAVVASYRDWRHHGGFDFESDPGHREALAREEARARRSYHVVLISMLWRSSMHAALAAQAEFGSDVVRVQRYEDLVHQPESTLRDVCDWLDCAYELSMHDVPMHNSSFSTYRQGKGISAEALERWRSRLSAVEIAAVQSVCGDLLARAGYARDARRASPLRVAWCWATAPVAAARSLKVNRRRIGNVPAYVWRRASLALGRSPSVRVGRFT